MAFDLLDAPLVYIPVKFPGLAVGDGGEAVAIEHEVEIQIELLDRDELVDWMQKANTSATANVTEQRKSGEEIEVFKRVAKGWRGIVVNGKVAPFTDKNLDALLRKPSFVERFATAYLEAWNGKVATREGNSEGSPANGPAVEPIAATPKGETSAS